MSNYRLDDFTRILDGYGFNFVYERKIPAGETVILRMPLVSANKRSRSDIGYTVDDCVIIYGTVAANFADTDKWVQIIDNGDINATVSALKLENTGNEAAAVLVRVIMC